MDVDDECCVCFVELGVKRGFLPCGCNQFCVGCADASRALGLCPLCRMAVEVQPEPLLLHFKFINGKTIDMTCHPDETLSAIGSRWKLGCDYSVIMECRAQDLDKPLSTLGIKFGQVFHVKLNLRSD